MDLREKMFEEFKDKSIFKQVEKYSFDYLDNLDTRNVFPTKEALKKLDNFSEKLPLKSADANELLEFLNENGSGSTVTTLGGRYFGFVCGSSIPASLAARVLSDFWDQSAAMNVLSPIAAKLETVVENWLKELFNLPQSTVAGFVSGSSLAILCGLAAGRYRIFKNNNWDINKKGFIGAPKIRIITSKEIHGTVLKVISILGFGTDNIEWVDTDNQGRIIASQVPQLDKNCIVILQAGNVCSGSFDDFESICIEAQKVGAWVHIDGAFGLWAGASEKLKHLTKGIEKGTSFSLDGHKTLNTPYDNGIVMSTDKEALTHALHSSGSYIVDSGERNGMFYTPEMSRRARSIELWAAMKYLGREGIDELVYGLHKRANLLASKLKGEGFQILNDVVFNQIVVRYEDDESTNKIMNHIQNSGTCWLGGAKWKGMDIMRISVCSWATTEKDIELTIKAFIDAKNSI